MKSQLEHTKNTQIDTIEENTAKETVVEEESTEANEEKKAEEIKSGEIKPEEKEPEETKSDEKESEKKEPEEKEPEETKPEETKPEDTKPEDTKPEEKQNKKRPSRVTKKKSPAKTRGPYITKNDEKVAAMINLIKQEPNLSIRAAARRVKLAESTAIRKMDKWNKMRELGEEEHFFSKREKKPTKLGVHHS